MGKSAWLYRWEISMRCLVVLLVALMTIAAAPAQTPDRWPQRTVTLVVPFSAGGSTDLIARILAQHMQTGLGVPVVVENRGGAGGSIGTGYVAKAPSDGYTLLVGTVSSNAINAFLYSKLPFDVARDLRPVSLLATLPNLLFVSPKIPAANVAELIAYLKANEGKASFGSSGNGTSSHLSSVMFQLATGTKMTHVPFRSTNEVMNSIIGGHIDLAIDSMTTAWPHAQSGAVRALAVTTPQRSRAAPDLPTIGETIKGFEATAWQGMFAPAGTPTPVAEKLAAELKRILDLPDVGSALRSLGAEPAPTTPAQFEEFTRAERAKWQEIVKASGARID
jgi:tripartite-type tricarboxylate transporter receptor subunit TctC